MPLSATRWWCCGTVHAGGLGVDAVAVRSTADIDGAAGADRSAVALWCLAALVAVVVAAEAVVTTLHAPRRHTLLCSEFREAEGQWACAFVV